MILELIIGIPAIICIFLYLYSNSSFVRPKGFPPGPTILPLVGSLLFLRNEKFEKLNQWHTKYGPLIGLQLGTFRTVIIGDVELTKSIFSSNAANARPPLEHLMYPSDGGKRGLSFTKGDHWAEMRPFFVKNLGALGFGKRSMEGMLLADIDHLMTKLNPGVPINTRFLFGLSILRSIWNIATSTLYDLDNRELGDICRNLSISLGSGFGGAAFFMPWINRIAPSLSNWDQFKKSIDLIFDHARSVIRRHLQEFQVGKVSDFVDAFLQVRAETTDSNSQFYGDEGIENLRCTLFNILGASSETTNGALNFAIAKLCINPWAQKEFAKEIERVIGSSRNPTLEDRNLMPFTQAMINEVLRDSPSTPLGVPHYALEDIHINGHIIPQGTVLLANIYQMCHDPRIWKDPMTFNPKRFLSPDGSYNRNSPSLMTFSKGKRRCPGEQMARNSLFIYLTCIIQRFQVSLEPTFDVRRIYSARGVTLQLPADCRFIFTERRMEGERS